MNKKPIKKKEIDTHFKRKNIEIHSKIILSYELLKICRVPNH
jgi:hypothetical protein